MNDVNKIMSHFYLTSVLPAINIPQCLQISAFEKLLNLYVMILFISLTTSFCFRNGLFH